MCVGAFQSPSDVIIPTISAFGSLPTLTTWYTNSGSATVTGCELKKGRWIGRIGNNGTTDQIAGLEYNGSSFSVSSSNLSQNAPSHYFPLSDSLALFYQVADGTWNVMEYTGGTNSVSSKDSGTTALSATSPAGDRGGYVLYQAGSDVAVVVGLCYDSSSNPVMFALSVDYSTPTASTVTLLDEYVFTGRTYTTNRMNLAVFGKPSPGSEWFFSIFWASMSGSTNRGNLYHCSVSYNTFTESFTLEKGETLLTSGSYENMSGGDDYEITYREGFHASRNNAKLSAEDTLSNFLMYRVGGSSIASNTYMRHRLYSMNSSTGTLTLEASDDFTENFFSGVVLYKNGSYFSDSQVITPLNNDDQSGSDRYESWWGFTDVDEDTPSVTENNSDTWVFKDGVTLRPYFGCVFTYDWDKAIMIVRDRTDSDKVKYGIVTITNS